MDYRGIESAGLADPASIDFSAYIAEHVMGWKTIQYEEWPGSFVPLLWHDDLGTPRGRDFGRLADGRWAPWTIPAPGCDIAAAMEVFMSFGDVFKTIAHAPRRSLGWTLGQPFEWSCTIYATNTVTAETLPIAICHAALKAKGVATPD